MSLKEHIPEGILKWLSL